MLTHAFKPCDPRCLMSLLGFSLVLAAAFCHATWNFFVKRIAAGPELVWLFSAIAAVIYLPAALYFASGFDLFAWPAAGFLAATAALHLAYFLLLQRGYHVGDLSLVYPTARACGPIISVTLAIVLLGERMSPLAALGGAIVIGGILMLTGGLKALLGGAGSSRALTSLAFGVATGCLIGAYTVVDAYAVSVVLIPPLVLDYASTLGRTVLLAPLAYRRRTKVAALWRDHRVGVLVIAVFNVLAYVLVLVALTFTPVVYVAPLRELSVLIAVLLGSLVLGEGEVKRRLFYAAIILVGVTLLAAS